MKLNNSDREAIEFAKTQRNAYGYAGILLIIFFLTYGVTRLFGITDAQILAWFIEKGVLLPK